MSLTDNDLICPVCGNPMRLMTVIRRVPGEQTFVLQCRPCGLSTTKTVDEPGPAPTTPQYRSYDHATFLFRCLTTGHRVQG
jgi:hypothetical protein